MDEVTSDDFPTPCLSVIIPAHNVEDYVEECVQSVMAFGGSIEVVVINDGSTDQTLNLVRNLTSEDVRVQILSSSRNRGLGPARNTGLEAARGFHVMFLDADDYLLPGALNIITTQLTSQSPDILIFDFVRSYPSGQLESNETSSVLQRYSEGSGSLRDRPDLLSIHNVAWNKVYRRDFLIEHDLSFTTGIYEDVPFTYPTLALAETIKVIPVVCIGYRQRQGSILQTSGSSHLDLIDQLRELFQQVDNRSELEPWREAFWNRALEHAWALLFSPRKRLGGRDRLVFFQQASVLLQKARPSHATLERKRHYVLTLGFFPTVLLVDLLAIAARAVRRIVRHLK